MTLLPLLGITDALAAAGTAAPSAKDGFMQMLPFLVLIVAFMYFFAIRPQQKRAKEHRELVGKLAKGDEVLTNGGLLGKITKVTDDFVVLALDENVVVTIQKSAVSGTMPKGTMKSV